MANILVVDDEHGIRDLLWEILNDEGHTVELAENAAQARAARLRERPDLVLLDIWMPDTDGVTLLKEWASTGALTMPVIMMSGHATIETAVEATKIGAMAFLEKPVTLQKLLKAVEQGLMRNSIAPIRSALGAQAVAIAAGFGATEVPLAPQMLSALQSFDLDRPLRDARRPLLGQRAPRRLLLSEQSRLRWPALLTACAQSPAAATFLLRDALPRMPAVTRLCGGSRSACRARFSRTSLPGLWRSHRSRYRPSRAETQWGKRTPALPRTPQERLDLAPSRARPFVAAHSVARCSVRY